VIHWKVRSVCGNFEALASRAILPGAPILPLSWSESAIRACKVMITIVKAPVPQHEAPAWKYSRIQCAKDLERKATKASTDWNRAACISLRVPKTVSRLYRMRAYLETSRLNARLSSQETESERVLTFGDAAHREYARLLVKRGLEGRRQFSSWDLCLSMICREMPAERAWPRTATRDVSRFRARGNYRHQ